MGTPSIFFKIGSKYDGKGIKDAESGVQGLVKSAKALSMAFKGTLIFGAVQGIKSLADKTTGAFLDQNKAVTNLNKSIANNAKLTAESAKRITSYVNKIPRVFDDDTINNTAAMVSNMGLAEEQIKAVMSAATDMASSGVTSLENAAKMLAQSYSGTSTGIAKLVPEIKNLTKEQLANGDAVAAISEKYKGYAEEMEGTFSGRNFKYQNALGNLKASIGGIFASIKFESQGKLLEPIENLTKKIEEIRPKIINFLLNITEIFSLTANAIKEVISNTFTADGLQNLKEAFNNFILSLVQNSIRLTVEMFKTLANITKAFFKNLESGDLGKLCLNAVESFCKKFLRLFAQPIDVVEAIMNGDWKKAGNIIIKGETGTFGSSITSWGGGSDVDLTKSINAMTDEMKKGFKNMADVYVDSAEGDVAAIKKLGEDISGGVFEELGKKIEKIMNRGTSSGAASKPSSSPITLEEGGEGSGEKKLEIGKEFKDALTGSLGELGSAINSFTGSAGFLGGVISVAVDAVKGIVSGLASSSENFSKTINFISTIVSGIVDGIKDFVDFLFTDIAETFTLIGQALGDILRPLLKIVSAPLQIVFSAIESIVEVVYNLVEVLSPLLEIIAEFIRLLAVFNVPLQILIGAAKLLSAVLSPLAAAMKAIYNVIYSIFDSISLPYGISIGWSGIKVKWKSLANFLGMKEMGEEEADEAMLDSGSGGGGASYTAARDVYVDIYFNQSYVNGDAKQIAVMLAREIRSAERMNLI